MIDWQPISEIPTNYKDGRSILVTDGEGSYAVVEWSEYAASDPLTHECIGWRDAGDMGWAGMVGIAPTHWAELQPPD